MLTRIFDTDQHITEPPDFWTSRAPAKFRHRVPQVVQSEELGTAWSYDGRQHIRPMGLQSVGSEDPRKIGPVKSYEEIDPGCYDPNARIEVLDVDGIEATLLFPSVMGACSAIRDDDLYGECFRAYNDGLMDWAIDGDPKRLVPVAQIPASGLEDAVAELKRVAEKGYRVFAFNGWPSGGEYPSEADDLFWACAEEAGLAMAFHGAGHGRSVTPLGTISTRKHRDGRADRKASLGRPQEMIAADRAAGLHSTVHIGLLVLSGVLERFPGLKIGLIETSVGWLPAFMEQLDAAYSRHRWLGRLQLNGLPSESIRRINVSFDREWLGVKHREMIGLDRLMFGTDYPHIGSFYPHSRFYLELLLHDAPAEEVEKILWGNAAELFGAK